MIIILGGIIYYGWTFYRANRITNKNRKLIQQKIVNNGAIIPLSKDYFKISEHSTKTDACDKISTVDIQSCNFCDYNGKPLQLSLYNCYVVHGDSMKYAGIKNNDFIFVPINFNLSSLTSLPEILVIRYRELKEHKPLYKVRRAWYKGNIDDDLEKAARSIMKMPKFSKLEQQPGYKGEEWMIKDLLHNRLEGYKSTYFKEGKCPEEYKPIVISTTFDTMKKEIHFSIEPTILVVGKVEEAYTIVPQ